MADYGASVDGVRALLPGVRVDATSRPAEADVEAWVGEYTAEVAARIGDLSTLSVEDAANATLRARRLVHLAVGATTLDAKFPERSGVTEDSYAAVLWERYTEGLAELVADVEAGELPGPDDEAGAGDPAGSFPEPLFTTSMLL